MVCTELNNNNIICASDTLNIYKRPFNDNDIIIFFQFENAMTSAKRLGLNKESITIKFVYIAVR